MDLKEVLGNFVYLLGTTRPELGGSHFNLVTSAGGGQVPGLPEAAPALYRALHQAMQAGQVRACHDLSEGGLAVAAAEMCIGGRLGLALNVDLEDTLAALFSELNGRRPVEVRSSVQASFERASPGCPWRGWGR